MKRSLSIVVSTDGPVIFGLQAHRDWVDSGRERPRCIGRTKLRFVNYERACVRAGTQRVTTVPLYL